MSTGQSYKTKIGNKMLEKAMDRGGDRWIIKTFLPRMLDFRHWIKEDIHDETMARLKPPRPSIVKIPHILSLTS